MSRPNFGNLKAHILPLSEEKFDFNLAKLEWELDYVVFTIEFGQCPCSQRIKEHCHLRNKINGNTTHVGNICVERFMGIDAGQLFNGLRKIRNNPEAPPNRDLIEYALARGYLYGDNEYDFLRNVVNKRRLSEKQKQWLTFINRRIIEQIVVRELPGRNNLDNIDHVIMINEQEQRIDDEDDSDQNASDDDDQRSNSNMISDSGNDSDYHMDESEESDDDMEPGESSISESDSDIEYESSVNSDIFEMSENEFADEALRDDGNDKEMSDENDGTTSEESDYE